jgi:hypothetical protein
LTRLSLLSQFAFVIEFFPEAFPGGCSKYTDRYRFAYLMWSEHDLIPTWMMLWFRSNIEVVQDEQEFEKFHSDILKRFKDLCADYKVVIFLDEIQVPMDYCSGYVRHQSRKTSVPDWMNEVQQGKATDGNRCTNLLYQLEHIMTRDYLDDEKMTFVVCSTWMKVWDVLETVKPPSAHSNLTKFVSLHLFNIEEVVSVLRKYFSFDDSFFDDGVSVYQ